MPDLATLRNAWLKKMLKNLMPEKSWVELDGIANSIELLFTITDPKELMEHEEGSQK